MAEPNGRPFTPSGQRSEALTEFLSDIGVATSGLELLDSDASSRRYYRLGTPDASMLVMDADPTKEDVSSFCRIADHLRTCGLRAPLIFARDITQGFLLLEDFGTQTLTYLLDQGGDQEALYTMAVDALVLLHLHPNATKVDVPSCTIDSLLTDVQIFAQWFVIMTDRGRLSASAISSLHGAWREVLSGLPDAKPALVLGDYHVDNIMLVGRERTVQSCGLLDFQDAVIGPQSFDLMSLLEDARRDVRDDLRENLKSRYRNGMGAALDPHFDDWFKVMAAHRHMRVLGIFSRLAIRDAKPHYLLHLARVAARLDSHRDHAVLAPVYRWLDAHCPHYLEDCSRIARYSQSKISMPTATEAWSVQACGRIMMETRKLFIAGNWVAPLAGGSIDVINPATAEVIAKVGAGAVADIAAATQAARACFEDEWGATSGAERAVYLDRIAAFILDRVDALARLEVSDNGKPYPEAKWDVEDAAGCFAMYANLARELDRSQWQPIELHNDDFGIRVRREPIGVAGQIIPWNYPFLMAAWKVAPALAAGATVVLKPSELTPLSALELAIIAQEVGLPAGALNIVTGTGPQAGAALLASDDIDKIAFTGSEETGKKVMHAAADRIVPVTLELGGKSPIVIFEDCDVGAAVEWVMFGAFWNQGEVCSATSRALVHRAIYDAFLERLVYEVNKITIGDGMAPGVLLGPLVSEAQHRKVTAMVAQGIADGAKLLTGGKRPPQLPQGYFFEPTVLTQVPEHSSLWREEVFGPVLCVAPFEDEEDAIARANATRFGLAGAVMSADQDRCDRVAARLRAGIIWINCSQPTFSEAPWGGFKRSGIGRELGQWGLENYLQVKQVTEYKSNKPWGWYIKQ